MMDQLPRSGFSLIDVRDTVLDDDPLSGKLKLPMLDAYFTGHIPGDMDELILQPNLPV